MHRAAPGHAAVDPAYHRKAPEVVHAVVEDRELVPHSLPRDVHAEDVSVRQTARLLRHVGHQQAPATVGDRPVVLVELPHALVELPVERGLLVVRVARQEVHLEIRQRQLAGFGLRLVNVRLGAEDEVIPPVLVAADAQRRGLALDVLAFGDAADDRRIAHKVSRAAVGTEIEVPALRIGREQPLAVLRQRLEAHVIDILALDHLNLLDRIRRQRWIRRHAAEDSGQCRSRQTRNPKPET